jgi:hypothetical protein
MGLIVENGAGLENANGYVSVAAFKAYCDDRALVFAAYTDAEIEGAIVRATDYIDGYHRYKGSRLSVSQAREFPRENLTDWGGLTVTGLPKQVVEACCDLAFKALAGPLQEDLDRGGRVKSESVGPISVTYADDAPAGKQYVVAHRLLQQFFRGVNSTGTPFFSTSEEPIFSADQFSFPGSGYPETQ